MYAVARHFFHYTLKKKKKKKEDGHGFLSYNKHYLFATNYQQTMVATWVRASQKLDFFVQKSWVFGNSKHFSQNIMTPCYSYYFCIFYIFNFF